MPQDFRNIIPSLRGYDGPCVDHGTKNNTGCIQANSNPQVVINKVGSVFVGIYYTTTPLLEFQIAMENKS